MLNGPGGSHKALDGKKKHSGVSSATRRKATGMQMTTCVPCLTQAHKNKQQQDQPQNHNGPLQRVQEATKLNAETRDPPSQDPRDT